MAEDAETETQTVAAVDLGSNSFHMLVARSVDGELHVVDRIKEHVALAEGLDEDGRLDQASRERALACLEKFAQRIRHMPADNVRVVGTHTLRVARNRRELVERAEEVLGHAVEVVPGREEARLIYLGVVHSLHGPGERRVIVDIGGGSTECVVGEGIEPIEADSLSMGHIDYTRRFFEGGSLSKKRMERAEVAAALEIQSIEARFRAAGWRSVVGASGTILSIAEILRAKGWSETGITGGGLRKLRKAVLDEKNVDDIDLPGLKKDRRTTLAGGLAILTALFDRLGIERMGTSDGALREGVVLDLLGRFRREDVRDRTVEHLMERHHVDPAQARRVEDTALRLLRQAPDEWELGSERDRQLLRWAARVHEVGLALSHSGYHKHGAYILEHSDMPGFSRDAQGELATLVLCHRRKLRAGRFDDLPRHRRRRDLHLCVLLRIAVRLNRSRSTEAVPEVRLRAKGDELHLAFPRGWLEDNPLTRADLEAEDERLKDALGWRLRCEEERVEARADA